MRLNEIQARFKDMIFGETDEAEFAGLFDDHHLAEGLGVYRNNVMGSVSGALISNFPLLEKLVGKDFLAAMIRAYILKNPPREGCLTAYGSDFGDFIETYEPAASLPYLPDVARLEIYTHLAYHARDDRALTAEDMARITADELQFLYMGLRDSVHLLDSNWPLLKIRALCMDERAETPDIHSGGIKILVNRPWLDVAVTPLANDEFEFLVHARNENFGTAYLKTSEKFPNFNLAEALQKFLDLQVFVYSGPNFKE